MLENLTVDTFAGHCGSSFRIVASPDLHVDAVLAEAQSLGEGSAGPGRQRAFSLMFHAPLAAPILPQRIYRLEHDVIGPFDLFIVPLGPQGGVFRYEVIFT
ncbi:MAG TPA: hypothetical protein VN783_03680 [Thermoanaerobaculia bacterium]|nr:hypothetical protein [Thermoanaerobaculia bacterium]